MARISGIDLPREKRVEVGLTYIYGIGLSTSQKLLKEAEVNPDTRVKDLTEEQVQAIRKAIDANHLLLEGDLRREVAISIKMLKEVGCYRGKRHIKRLPARGQRTNRNAITARGGKRQIVANKKK